MRIDLISTYHPFITPSTFNIGTILNTKLFRSFSAFDDELNKYEIAPSITQDELASPG